MTNQLHEINRGRHLRGPSSDLSVCGGLWFPSWSDPMQDQPREARTLRASMTGGTRVDLEAPGESCMKNDG